MDDKRDKKGKRDVALQSFFCRVCNLINDLVTRHPELKGIWNETKKVDKKTDDIRL